MCWAILMGEWLHSQTPLKIKIKLNASKLTHRDLLLFWGQDLSPAPLTRVGFLHLGGDKTRNELPTADKGDNTNGKWSFQLFVYYL